MATQEPNKYIIYIIYIQQPHHYMNMYISSGDREYPLFAPAMRLDFAQVYGLGIMIRNDLQFKIDPIKMTLF